MTTTEAVAPVVTPFAPELEQMRLALGLGVRDYVEKSGFREVVLGRVDETGKNVGARRVGLDHAFGPLAGFFHDVERFHWRLNIHRLPQRAGWGNGFLPTHGSTNYPVS